MFGLTQKEGGWGRGYGMDGGRVAYEDDIAKNRGPKVSRHGALDSELG